MSQTMTQHPLSAEHVRVHQMSPNYEISVASFLKGAWISAYPVSVVSGKTASYLPVPDKHTQLTHILVSQSR